MIYRKKILEGKSGMALKRRRSKWLIFRLFLPLPYTVYPSKLSYDSQNWSSFNPRSWIIQWWISPIGRIQFDNVFLVGLLLYVVMQSLIAWSNEQVWHQLSTIIHLWTPPPLSPCLSTTDLLSLFSYQFSLPSSLCYEQNFYFAQCPKRQEGYQLISE